MRCLCKRLQGQCDLRFSRRTSSVGSLSFRGRDVAVICGVLACAKQRSRAPSIQREQQACNWAPPPVAVHATTSEADACIRGGGDEASAGSGGSNNINGRSKLTGESDEGDSGRGHKGSSRHFLQVLLSVLLPSTLLQLAHAEAAAAWGRSQLVAKKDERLLPEWEIDAFIDRMWDLSGPIMNNMGFSGLVGAASAAALKWVGRTLAASVGIALILVQVLSYWNVVTVNWSVVHQQAALVLDRTGDGRLDQDDFKRVLKKGMIILSEGVPSMSGFLVGFIVGLRVF